VIGAPAYDLRNIIDRIGTGDAFDYGDLIHPINDSRPNGAKVQRAKSVHQLVTFQ
jgi:hypothetical protein